MKNRFNPSSELKKNDKIYNTFSFNQNLDEVLNYLASLYEHAVENPLPVSDFLNKFKKFPDHLKIYMMVEIQKMILEKNCFAFEKRQPGCLKAYFTMLGVAFNNINDLTISRELIKRLHKESTDVNKVKMEIEQKESGEYRSNDFEYLMISADQVSVDGLERLIELMNKNMETMMIGRSEDFDKMNLLTEEYYACKQINSIQQQIMNKTFSGSALDTINRLLRKDHLTEQDLTEQEILKSFEINKVKERFSQQIDVWLKESKEKQNEYLNDESLSKEEQQNLITEESITALQFAKIKDDLNSSKTLDETIQAIMKLYNQGIDGMLMVAEINQENRIQSEEKLKQAVQYNYTQISKNWLSSCRIEYRVNTDRELAEALFLKLQEGGKQTLRFQFAKLDELDKLMDEFITDYNKNVDSCKTNTPDEKLYFIFDTIQKFLLVHPFVDANNRTFVNGLANRLLVQHGFPPAFYFNPFVFYAHSVSEIVEVVKLACANFLAVEDFIKNGYSPYFNFSDTHLSQAELKEIDEFTKPFKDFIDKETVKNCVANIEKMLQPHLLNQNQMTIFKSESSESGIINDDIQKLKSCKNMEEVSICLKSLKANHDSTGRMEIAEVYDQILKNLLQQQPVQRQKA